MPIMLIAYGFFSVFAKASFTIWDLWSYPLEISRHSWLSWTKTNGIKMVNCWILMCTHCPIMICMKYMASCVWPLLCFIHKIVQSVIGTLIGSISVVCHLELRVGISFWSRLSFCTQIRQTIMSTIKKHFLTKKFLLYTHKWTLNIVLYKKKLLYAHQGTWSKVCYEKIPIEKL